ncbi:MAG: pilus assembly protein N-terminal domain-containing protein [Verrucomicrobia bacterium]|nr:pilus assembly protein N-terminal domain-containing protein [Deltaproteobacteria bacterium]
MNFNYCRIVLLSLSLLLPLDAGLALGGVPTTVIVNKSVLLTLQNPARMVTVTDPDIIAVPEPLQRKQLLINGKKIGSTSMVIWEENVNKPTFFDIQVVGDRDIIEAQIREYAPHDAITVQYAKDTVILSGTVTNEQTMKKAEEIAQAYAAKVLNHIAINSPQQVLLQVKVAQIDKTSLKKLGISAIVKGATAEGFTNLAGAPKSSDFTAVPGIAGTSPGLGSFDPLDAFQVGVSYFPAGIGAVLQALSTKGLAKILAEPNLLVKSGQEGNFLAGSRIPYSVLISTGGASTSSIVFETVGIKVKFKPEVMENGLIRLKIDPAEVSSIAGTLAVNGYPIIDTRDVRTTVELRDGESLVLAGLLQEEQIKTMSKIPLLGDIPILGALFRSTQNDLKEKELVFFITPKIVQPNAPDVTTVLPTDKGLTADEEKELNWMPLGD